MKYAQAKGLIPSKKRRRKSVDASPPKSSLETAVTEPQWRQILEAIESTKDEFNKNWKRDYTAIYLGYMFALRLSECSILERDHFKNLEKDDTVDLPTQGKANSDTGLIEEATAAVVLDYVKNEMRPDQRWLFESKVDYHVSESYLARIFNTYALKAGLPNTYSWQSLRHGRGFRLWSLFHNLSMVAIGLRCDIDAVTRYASLDPELEKEYVKTLNRAAFNPVKQRKVGVKIS